MYLHILVKSNTFHDSGPPKSLQGINAHLSGSWFWNRSHIYIDIYTYIYIYIYIYIHTYVYIFIYTYAHTMFKYIFLDTSDISRSTTWLNPYPIWNHVLLTWMWHSWTLPQTIGYDCIQISLHCVTLCGKGTKPPVGLSSREISADHLTRAVDGCRTFIFPMSVILNRNHYFWLKHWSTYMRWGGDEV